MYDMIERRIEAASFPSNPRYSRATYDISGICGLEGGSKLEIKIQPARKWVVFKRMETSMTVTGAGAYCRPVVGTQLPRAILTMEDEIVDVNPSGTITEHAELKPDKTGNVDDAIGNRDKLYGMARAMAHDIVVDSVDDYAALQDVFEKCLEIETGLVLAKNYGGLSARPLSIGIPYPDI